MNPHIRSGRLPKIHEASGAGSLLSHRVSSGREESFVCTVRTEKAVVLGFLFFLLSSEVDAAMLGNAGLQLC